MLRWLLVWTPIAILAMWGYSYLRLTYETLQSPGVPVELKYTTKGGATARLMVESYVLNVEKGYARLNKIRFIDPAAVVLAQIDHIELTGLNALYGGDQVLKVRGSNLQGRLVRLKSGKFQLEELLPPDSGEKSKMPFEVHLDRISLDLVDHAGNGWSERLTTPRVVVAGLGDNWVARASGRLSNMGDVDVRLQRLAGFGINVTGATSRFEVAKLLNHVATTPEARGLAEAGKTSVGSLLVRGPFRVFLPEKRALRVESTIFAQLENARYGDYTIDSATFRGLVTEQGAVGHLEAREGANRGVVDGSMRWDKTQRFAGRVTASSPSPRALPAWARKQIPADANYEDAVYRGWAAYFPDSGMRLSGDVVADRLTYQGESVQSPTADLRYAEGQAVVRLESGFFRGERAAGVVAYEPESRKLIGGLNGFHVDLADLAREFKFPAGITGEAVVSANLQGTVDDPLVTFNVSGSGAYRYQKWRVPIREFQASGVYQDGALKLERAMMQSPVGLLMAEGGLDKSGQLAIDVTVRGFRARPLDERMRGSGNLQARVTGTLKDPRVKGRLEGYALRFEEEMLPAVTADFTANLREARLTNLHAIRGSAVVNGSARYTFKNQGIEGDLDAENIQLADFLGPEFVGSVQVPSLEFGGTISKPVITGIIRGQNILARGVKVETLQARAETVNGVVTLRDTFAQAAGGTVRAEGSYDPQKKGGTITVTASSIDLDKLLPEFAAYLTVGGEVSGQATVTLENGALAKADGKGQLESVAVNGTTLGSGLWTVHSNGKTLAGTLEIGQLDGFLTLQNFTFDPETQVAGGKLELLNVKVADLVAISQRYLPATLDYQARQALASVKGQLSAGALFSLRVNEDRAIDDATLNVPTLEVKNIKFKDAAFESLNTAFTLKNDVWDVKNFTLLGDPKPREGVGRKGQARYAFSGVLDEHGSTDVSGDFTNIALQELSAFVPWFTGKSGDADFYFAVKGPTSSPVIRASVEAKGMLAELDEKLVEDVAAANAAGVEPDEVIKRFYDKTLRISISDIVASGGAEGAIDIQGDYFWRGFQGTITAHAPFDFPFVIPRDRAASGKITLADRELQPIAELLNGLSESASKTKGKVSGQITASGTPADLSLTGDATVTAETLGIDGVADSLKNVKAKVVLEPKRIVATLEGESSRGGSVKADVAAPITDLRNFAEAVESGVLTTLLDNPVSGSLAVTKLSIRETVLKTGTVGGVLQANIGLSGTVAAPMLKGDVSVSRGDTQLPGFESTDTERETPLINPKFDIALNLADPAHIRSSLADLYLLGNGSLTGTLDHPNIRANLHVDKGSINLPGSRVRIEQGGTVEVRYNTSSLDSFASVQVDMEGRTSVSAARFGDIIERYDVFLGIRGDLLKEGGLLLTASSDPPDLSQDRILALLGQAELLSSIGSNIGEGSLASDTEKKVRNALLSYALPAMLDPVTSGIAQSLSLDYLSLEYNAYEQAALVFARTLGGGWSIQGRRQITAPPPGFPTQFDIRLVYRPRRLPGILNRFSFSVGADETRPWKVGVEYSTRFWWR